MLQTNLQTPWKIDRLISNIMSTLNLFGEVRFAWIDRAQNAQAHSLEQMGIRSHEQDLYICSPCSSELSFVV